MGYGYGPPAHAMYRRPPVWFIVLFALGFLVGDVSLARDLLRRHHLARHGAVTMAEAAVREYPSKGGQYELQYTFTISGRRHEGSGYVTEAEATPVRRAHRVEVAYLPENPQISAVRSETTSRSLRTGTAILCLLTIVPGLLVLLAVLSRRQPPTP